MNPRPPTPGHRGPDPPAWAASYMYPVRVRYPIQIRWPLHDLLHYCARRCVVPCCGLQAVDLAPIHVASWVLTVDSNVLSSLLVQLRDLRGESGRGMILHNDEFRATWTREEFHRFLDGVKQRLKDAEQVIRYASELEDHHPWSTYEEPGSRPAPGDDLTA